MTGIADIPDASSGEQLSPWEGGTPAEKILRWYYCQSGGELGEHSAWDSLVFMAQVGGHTGAQLTTFSDAYEVQGLSALDDEATCPAPPPARIAAAARQARVRKALRSLTPPEQGLLEWSFSPRRPDVQLVGLIAAEREHLEDTGATAEQLEPVVAYMLATGKVTLKMDGSGGELPGIIAAAAAARERALTRFAAAYGLADVTLDGAIVSKSTPRSRSRIGIRVAAGTKGASKRRLTMVEAPRERQYRLATSPEPDADLGKVRNNWATTDGTRRVVPAGDLADLERIEVSNRGKS